MDTRLLLVYVLVFLTMIAVGASTVIESNPDPIHFRVSDVELVGVMQDEDSTRFIFDTISQIWNERVSPYRIDHAKTCPVQTGVLSNVDGYIMVDQPICSSRLEQTWTTFEPGLTEVVDQVIIEFHVTIDELPSGNYTFITYPETQDFGGKFVYQVDSGGEVTTEKYTPAPWGEISYIKSPISWYIPSYLMLAVILFKQIQYFYDSNNKKPEIKIIKE